ncbi:hypothetical protein HWV62_15447 [Athelia sp. TMB]|nr:hypothetical protein HWV62_15447 [Athelia sp. TMB]
MHHKDPALSGLRLDFEPTDIPDLQFPWFKHLASRSDISVYESLSYPPGSSTRQAALGSRAIGMVCDQFDAPSQNSDMGLHTVKVCHPGINSFELTPIPVSGAGDSSFDICVYYLQNASAAYDTSGQLDSSDCLLRHGMDTMSTTSELGGLCHHTPNGRWAKEMFQRESPLKKVIRLCRAEVATGFPLRSSASTVPLLLPDTSFSSAFDSPSPRPRPFCSQPKSPLSCAKPSPPDSGWDDDIDIGGASEGMRARPGRARGIVRRAMRRVRGLSAKLATSLSASGAPIVHGERCLT